MAKAVQKYVLPVNGEVVLPIGAVLLAVHPQGGDLCLWAEIDPDAGTQQRKLNIYGTTALMPAAPGRYVGTGFLGRGIELHVYDPSGA